MASASAARVISNILRTKSTIFYELAEIAAPAITRRKQKLLEKIEEISKHATKSGVARKLKVAKEYYKLEIAPPTSMETKQLQADVTLVKEFMKNGCYKYLTVKQAWLLFLVCSEVYLWFYLGETIGKMHFVGYSV